MIRSYDCAQPYKVKFYQAMIAKQLWIWLTNHFYLKSAEELSHRFRLNRNMILSKLFNNLCYILNLIVQQIFKKLHF